MGTDHGAYGPGERVEQLPVMQGAVFGSVAHVTGLVVTYLVLVLDSDFEFGASSAAETGTVDELGWLFFSAHFARVERVVPFGGADPQRAHLITETSFQLPAVVLYAIPVVLLIGAGTLLVSEADLRESSPGAYATAGATLVVGYFPFAGAGILLFETRIGVGEATFIQSPELSSTLGLVGLAHPLCFGAVGGVLYALLSRAGAEGTE